jgi:hypothetical protein
MENLAKTAIIKPQKIKKSLSNDQDVILHNDATHLFFPINLKVRFQYLSLHKKIKFRFESFKHHHPKDQCKISSYPYTELHQNHMFIKFSSKITGKQLTIVLSVFTNVRFTLTFVNRC